MDATVNEKTLDEALEQIGNQVNKGESIGGESELSHEDAKLLYTLGYALYQSGDLNQSESVFRRLVIARPLDQKHWIGLAAVLQVQGQYQEALTCWSMTCLLDDKDPSGHYHAAECLLSLKNVEESKKALLCAEERIKDKNHSISKKIQALKLTLEG